MSTFHNDKVVLHKQNMHFLMCQLEADRKIAQMRRNFFEERNDKGTNGHHTYSLNGSTEIK